MLLDGDVHKDVEDQPGVDSWRQLVHGPSNLVSDGLSELLDVDHEIGPVMGV